MKRLLVLVAFALGMTLSAQAQQRSSSSQGPMTLNPWNYKLSVGGVVVNKESWGNYFTAEDLAMYKSGKKMNDVGGIIACVGAAALGFGIGYTATSDGPALDNFYDTAKNIMWVGLGVTALGLAINIPGYLKMKKAVKNYYASLSYQPELRFGATNYGIGLALAF